MIAGNGKQALEPTAMGTGVTASQEQRIGLLTSCLTERFQKGSGFCIDATTANAATRRTSTRARQQTITQTASKTALIHRRPTSTAKMSATDTRTATFLRMTSDSFDVYAQKVFQGQK